MKTFACFLLLLPFTAFSQTEIKCAAVVENGYWKTIDTNGYTIADSLDKYNDVPRFYFMSQGMFFVHRDNKIGIKTYKNQWITPCIFTQVREFTNGFAAVCSNDKWGMLNRYGKYIADTIYDYLSNATEDGVIVLRKQDTIAVIDTAGHLILPFFYLAAKDLFPEPEFADGLLRVAINRHIKTVSGERTLYRNSDQGRPAYKIGFVDKHGKLVIDTTNLADFALRDRDDQNTAIMNCGTGMLTMSQSGAMSRHQWYVNGDFYRFEGGRCLVVKNYTSIVINTRGDSLFNIPTCGYSPANTGGYFVVNDHGPLDRFDEIKYGVYSPGGEMILPVEYKAISKLKEGKFVVTMTSGASKYADTTGRFLFRDSFDLADEFAGGIARVMVSGQANTYGHINRKGELLSYDKTGIWLRSNVSNDWLIAKYRGKWGYMNEKFEWIINPELFDEALGFCNDRAMVKIAGKWGYINRQGKPVIQCLYDFEMPFQTIKIL